MDNPGALPRAIFFGEHENASWYEDSHPDYTGWPEPYGRVAVANVTVDPYGLDEVIWGQPGSETPSGGYTLRGAVYVINGDTRFGDGGTTVRMVNGTPVTFYHDNFSIALCMFPAWNNSEWQDWFMWTRIAAQGYGDHLGACVAGMTTAALPGAGVPDNILAASAPLASQGKVYAIHAGGPASEDLLNTVIRD
jgi:hypothetical protein